VPLVLDPDRLAPDQLRELLAEMREGLASILPRLDPPPAGYRDPISLLTAADLVRDALTATERLAGPGADRAELGAAVNVAYSAMLAAIDLLKVHSGGPQVPQGPKAKAPAGRRGRRRAARRPTRRRRPSRAGSAG
jgi:hypothetical protein